MSIVMPLSTSTASHSTLFTVCVTLTGMIIDIPISLAISSGIIMCINAVCLPNLPHSQCAWRLLSSRYMCRSAMCRSAMSSSYGPHILDISPSTCFSLACTEPLRQSLPFPAYLSSVLTMWPFQGCLPTLESEYTVTSLWTCWLLGRNMIGYYCYLGTWPQQLHTVLTMYLLYSWGAES